jgi:hypothetical protein
MRPFASLSNPRPPLLALWTLACLAAALAGCSDKTEPQLTSPSAAPALRPQQQSAGSEQQVTGSVLVDLTEFGGAPQRMAFSAIRHRDGRVSGQFQIFSEQEPGIRVHGVVTCLGIDGNLARLGGVITKSSPTGFESPAFWAVVDNGEGPGAPPDQSSDVGAFAPPELVEEFCALGFELPFLPSLRGNIQVHP